MLQRRVSFGVRADTLALTEIPVISSKHASLLYAKGIRTHEQVAAKSVEELAQVLAPKPSSLPQEQEQGQRCWARWVRRAAQQILDGGCRPAGRGSAAHRAAGSWLSIIRQRYLPHYAD
jgi:hypothetical protein